MNLVKKLSPTARRRIKDLSGARPVPFIVEMAAAWAVVGLSVSAALYFNIIIGYVIAIYVIATRQNIMALLIHEQTHYLGLDFKFGDAIVNIFAGYPLVAVTVEDYANIHLRHHRNYFTLSDPDFLRKSGSDWMFPMKLRKLGGLFARDLIGVSFAKFVAKKAEKMGHDWSIRRKYPTPYWLRISCLVMAIITITILHIWSYIAIFWLLPLMTVFPAIVRWGAICEHSYGEEGASVEETSPVILPTLMGRIFLPNMNFTMHPYHHFFPGVSFSKLPEVHRIVLEEGLVCKNQLFKGHFDYCRYIVKGPRDMVEGAA